MLAFDLEAFGDGAILGCDFAGTVEALGPNSTSFSIGDRVASFIWGGKMSWTWDLSRPRHDRAVLTEGIQVRYLV